ncbi:CTD phosphatase Fcp1 [Coemansia sp. IMI 209127]|nr:CTD phosphatase Fcp1 [Coemansia sp. IMI 209127]
MESTKLLCIPQTREPAKVVGFSVSVGDSVEKLAPVLIYEYKEKFQEGNESVGEDSALLKALKKTPDAAGYLTKRAYLRSPFEGKVTNLLCSAGDEVQHSDALVEITIPCSHSAVFNGLCALCGKDVSEIDSTGVPDTQAQISMFHDNSGLKVSYDMAASIDADTRERLWGHEKLSLIIDLDMTIIHATAPLNPGFEHWLAENYDGPRGNLKESDDSDEQPDTKHTTLPDDIGFFDLPVIPSRHFIKLRPDLREFLEKLSRLYEMHIYTMGSRPYADAVAKLIDPECKYFSGRILSRDENGSKDRKSLRRLFPVDTSMVVIIDDRADVWDWSPNLIRVHQYEFFTGVGDINAGHLPPVRSLGPEVPPEIEKTQNAPPPSDTGSDAATSKESSDIPDDKSKAEEGDASSSGGSTAVETATPESSELDDTTGNRDAPTGSDAVVRADIEYSSSTEEGKPVRRPHLVDNDRELTTIQDVLVQLHKEYYTTLDPSHEMPLPDVARILSMKKGVVLNGASLAFTAVFLINPGSPPPQRTDLWVWAQNFGARCELEVSDRTTHVIAGKPGTEKVHAARRLSNRARSKGGCSPIIVKKEWLLHSIYRWEWLDETPYLWFEDDKDLAVKSAERRESRRKYADSPVNKRKSTDEGDVFEHGGGGDGNTHKRLHRSTIERLKRQVDRATHEYDSANTTDIEDELERQEEGLEEHVAQIDDFVQNIDWDDLEREIMEDTDESDDNQSSSDSQPPGGSASSRNPSRTPSVSGLRQKALKQAAKRRRVSRGGTGESGDEGDAQSAARHSNRRSSNLARADGSLDINTNTEEEEEEEESGDEGNDSDASAKAAPPSKRESDTRGFWADKIKMPAKKKTILDADTAIGRSKRGNNDDEFESDRDDVDEPLFAGVEDKNGDYIHDNEDDDDEDSFVNATSREEGGNGAKGGYQSDGSSNEDWGEDDDSDDDNFDDLINDLEEEIASS